MPCSRDRTSSGVRLQWTRTTYWTLTYKNAPCFSSARGYGSLHQRRNLVTVALKTSLSDSIASGRPRRNLRRPATERDFYRKTSSDGWSFLTTSPDSGRLITTSTVGAIFRQHQGFICMLWLFTLIRSWKPPFKTLPLLSRVCPILKPVTPIDSKSARSSTASNKIAALRQDVEDPREFVPSTLFFVRATLLPHETHARGVSTVALLARRGPPSSTIRARTTVGAVPC